MVCIDFVLITLLLNFRTFLSFLLEMVFQKILNNMIKPFNLLQRFFSSLIVTSLENPSNLFSLAYLRSRKASFDLL